ncbi:MAG: hypothetical protein A3B23_01675 [Candidatus Colwellbacteria bacterium RIFCSPLOWO2_01_FULL_48_10]|uniref:Uncharacterized protein n=1 Tax=Candidatus Colwellbacteria bacterium RIFCSPLOWO2_01_FULL_48_10 TaxID=1797690 RepID=A0A1G1Z8J4_9BACT|nr:MAG: hypothetical protein A3B23_01675 [Candidatus Colwellbacteria bacterium RIFCSPLOWO2_01_FULL_48_10]
MSLEKVILEEIRPGVIHLDFPTQELMAMTFLRFQEYYESPEFRGRVFTREEFERWYIEKRGSFSYAQDWPGFNIPSEILRPFYDGRFDPLSAEEKEFLQLFRGRKEPFYIIGTSKGNPSEYMDHELAHALFSTNKGYKSDVMEIISLIPRADLKEFWDMINIGYHESVMVDEVQAHFVANFDELVREGLSEEKFGVTQKNILGIYNRHLKL